MSKFSVDSGARSNRGRDLTRAIGGILVMSGRISEADAQRVRQLSTETGLRFGDAAVQLNLITQEDIEFALARQFNYPILSHGRNGEVSDDVVAAYDPHSHKVEELRSVRSHLLIGWLNRAPRNVLAIVSPQRGEGRSWLAANLATVFAQAGERTLLIDADLRNPQQHKFFNLNNDVGLSELMTGRAGKDIARRIQPQLRLFVAPAGRTPPNPQELISRPVFDMVLERFSKQFDLVIIDTPAAAETADAQVLAARAGSAVMVTRIHHTRRSALKTSMSSLVRAGVNVVGSILNEH